MRACSNLPQAEVIPGFQKAYKLVLVIPLLSEPPGVAEVEGVVAVVEVEVVAEGVVVRVSSNRAVQAVQRLAPES